MDFACLPVRCESRFPAQQMNALVLNGDAKSDHPLLSRCFRMGLKAEALVNLSTAERRPLGGAPFKIGTTIEAVAGLGNPERFFSLLEDLPYPIQLTAFQITINTAG